MRTQLYFAKNVPASNMGRPEIAKNDNSCATQQARYIKMITFNKGSTLGQCSSPLPLQQKVVYLPTTNTFVQKG